MKLKYDWDRIEHLKYNEGLTWDEVAEEIDMGINGKSLSKQYSQRRVRARGKRLKASSSIQNDPDTPSLGEFVRQKRLDAKRATCPICQYLDESVRQQLVDAGAKGITRKEQVAWLEEVYGLQVTSHEVSAHFQGRHDDD